MSRVLFYGGLFLVLIVLETSFMPSLPFPWSLFPVVPIAAIWLYHQFQSRIGIWLLLGWGVWHDAFGLSLWSSTIIAALVMTLVLIYASRRIFSHRSLYGLLGLTTLVWLAWVVIEALFRFLSPHDLDIAFHGFTLRELTLLGELLLGTGLLFILSLRLRERLRL